ncbi:MAG: bifunctional aspartate kinase/homoserine dehydrogenase I [Pyrinomonadaceae bacterium]
MKVLKFGGTSVGSAGNIEKVGAIVADELREDQCVIVLSAMQGTTDALIRAGRSAETGDESFRAGIEEIENRHLDAVRQLLPVPVQSGVLSFVKKCVNEIENICEGVFLLRELSPRTLDRIMSFGEILSSRIVSAKFDSLGMENLWTDSRELIRTDSNFGFAGVDFEKTNRLINDFFKESESRLHLLPGFIASNGDRITTTLGRGGSDYTGAILAAALDAAVFEIWTDVSGMMTADPRLVCNIRPIDRITYREALELSHFGAKVIYPPTIQPVLQKNIPILIKNTFAPEESGTLIESETPGEREIIRGITSIDKISILSLEGSGMVGIPGFSKRLFDALSRALINVILITQSSSEHSICVGVEEKFEQLAREVVDNEFEYEIALGRIEPLRAENGFSILALVGDRMKEHTGISGKMFSALGSQGINIHAIAQGSSERNISAVIASADVRKAVNTLHEEFFSGNKKQINLFIMGVGNVGRRLLEQLRGQSDYLNEKMNLNVRVVGLGNSRKTLFAEDGLDLSHWEEKIKTGKEFENRPAPADTSAQMADLILKNNLRNSIFVDITASEKVIGIYPQLLEKSVSIIACNKIAASSALENYQKLKDLAREYNAQFLFETNVGAGLPIINTLNDLLRSGDKINRIEAVLSGTLNFVFNHYDGTRKFSEVVRQAQEEGYTEPDPRLDLSGTDVARKILILAREAGFKLEMSDIENRGFLPESCLKGEVEDFYAEMERHEDHFRGLLENARHQGLSLKYIASFDRGKASVGLESIPPEHNFANLSGKDNAVLFYTDRYSDLPLVVKGAGAGADVTAAGVFADIIRATKT